MPPDTLLFAAPGSLGPTLAAVLFGLLVGSFLNVVIHRMPVMMEREEENYIAEKQGKPLPFPDRYNLMVPRSACPHCQHQITALENIPIVSWLALRGKCSNCKAPISPRYPVVELVAGLLAGLMVWTFGSGWTGLATVTFGLMLLTMTMIDLDTQLLPDDLTLSLLWLGLMVNLDTMFVPLREAVIGAMAGYLFLWAVNGLYKLVRGHDGMGMGDFKLLAALGAWFGWTMLPTIILLSSVVGSVVGIGLIFARRLGWTKPIPFGPYLAGAGLVTLFHGQQVAALIHTLVVRV
jgi:leader peptidase (prepilin peptidase)/N-methyltransferase